MPDRSIVTRLRVEASQFLATMGKASKAVEGVGKSADKSSKQAGSAFSRLAKSARENETHINRMGNSALVAGGAIAAGLGFGAKAFADFDAAMSGVNAALPEAGANLERLRQAAIDLGSDTQFSATEAAQGITELGKAGVAAGDILGGGLKGSLDLAAAGQLGVAEAAETAATAMVQFKLEGTDVPHIADLLAAGAGKAQGSVHDLGMALNQAGLVAAGMGLSIEETTGGLAAFAAAGLVGSDAGTSFKTMIQRLQAPVGDAADMLDKYNISAYDASGNFVGLANVAGQLQTKLSGLTPEVRNNALAVIFGSDAVRAANVLYENGATGISKWVGAVNDAGFASEQAAKLTDNLKGDLERLGGALDGVFVQNGEGANGALRSIVQGTESLVEAFGNLPEPAQQGSVALAGVTAAGLLAVGMLARGVTAAADFSESMDKIRVSSPKAAKGIDLTTKAAKGLGAALAIAGAAAAASTVFGGEKNGLRTEQLTKSMLSSADAVGVLDQAIADVPDKAFALSDAVNSFGDVLKLTFDAGIGEKIDDTGGKILEAFGGTNQSAISTAEARLSEIDATLSTLVAKGDITSAASLFGDLSRAAEEQGYTVDELKKKLPLYGEALAGVSTVQAEATTTADKIRDGLGGVGQAAADAQESVVELADEIRGFGKTALDADEARDKLEKGTIDFSNTVKDNAEAVKKGEKTKREAYLDNKDALRGLADLALENSAATLEQTGSAEKAAAAMRTGRQDFIDAAAQLNITGTAAEDLADKYGLIPEDVTTTVAVDGAATARLQVQNLIDTIAKLNDKSVKIGVRYTYEGRMPNGGVNLRGGSTAADGGVFDRTRTGMVRAFADGGTIGSAQPQIRAAGGAGILWAEEGAGPWEAFISGHPNKRARSRMIAQDTVERLGGQIKWARPFADGGMLGGVPTSSSVTHDSSLNAESVTIVTEDARSFQRGRWRTVPYDAKARPGR